MSNSASALVLYVEDDILLHDLVQTGLEDAGFSVIIANTAEAGLGLLREKSEGICGVITDINLGAGPDGWAVAHEARGLNPALPIIYVSGLEAAQWPVQGVPQSVMISKPFAPAQLVVALANLLNAAGPEG